MKLGNKAFLWIYAWIPFAAIGSIATGEQQFVFLAKSFIEGKLYLTQIPGRVDDLALYQGHYYWPLGPFPAVTLMPFVAVFGTNFMQLFIQLPLNILNYFLLLKICQKLTNNNNLSHLIAAFFIFGSTYTTIAAMPFSWYFGHVIATTLLLGSLYEFLNKKRYLIIGILVGCALLTRLDLLFASIFFVLTLSQKDRNVKTIVKLFSPIVISVILLLSYNYARFQSPSESGYKYQIIPIESRTRRDEGIFALHHIPTNLYFMLLSGFQPIYKTPSHTLIFPYIQTDPYGTSLFIFSPILFLIFKTKLKDKYVKASLITSAVIAVPVLTYYGIGYIQAGYRYALDFIPFLLIPLCYGALRTKIGIVRLLVSIGIVITWYALIIRVVLL